MAVPHKIFLEYSFRGILLHERCLEKVTCSLFGSLWAPLINTVLGEPPEAQGEKIVQRGFDGGDGASNEGWEERKVVILFSLLECTLKDKLKTF